MLLDIAQLLLSHKSDVDFIDATAHLLNRLVKVKEQINVFPEPH